MSLFDAAERIAQVDRLNVLYDSNRCLHEVSQLSDCEACFNLCPVQAIKPGKPPTFKNIRCVNCLACIPACPVNAYDAVDAHPALLKCAARIGSSKVELICHKNSHPEMGFDSSAIAIRIRGCLAGIGSSAYLGLTILGKTEIFVRLEDCIHCELGSLKDRIRDQINLSQWILSNQPKSSITIIEDLGEPPLNANRPIWNADNPPVSRRDLFRLVSKSGDLALVDSISKNVSIQGRIPGRERVRTNKVLNQLLEQGHLNETISLGGFHYALLSVNSDCYACGVCARVCPTEALIFEQKENQFQLNFLAQNCIGCAICQKVCTPNAMSIDCHPSLGKVFTKLGYLKLVGGNLVRCTQCNVWFAMRRDEKYCPICSFRVQTPFGARMPLGFQSKDKS